MSHKMNQVVIMGNLTKDPDVHEIPSGSVVARISVATTQRTSKKDDNNGEAVCFVDVEAWGKQAEACGKFLTKGHLVLIEGSLRHSQWETKEGEKRSKLSVRATCVHFLNGKKNGTPDTNGVAAPVEELDW